MHGLEIDIFTSLCYLRYKQSLIIKVWFFLLQVVLFTYVNHTGHFFLILLTGCIELSSNLKNDYPARLKSVVVGFSQKYVDVFTQTHTLRVIACAERQHSLELLSQFT